jgi:hypothetical protein
MAIIYTYPVKTNPVGDDLILISDSADKNNTKQVKVSTLPSSGGGSVSSVGFSLSGLDAFNVTGDNPVTGSGTITLGTTGGSSGQYLDYQGNWSTPASTTYDVMGSGNNYAAGLVLAGNATHNNNFLRKDGTWAIPVDTGISFSNNPTANGLVTYSNSTTAAVSSNFTLTTSQLRIPAGLVSAPSLNFTDVGGVYSASGGYFLTHTGSNSIGFTSASVINYKLTQFNSGLKFGSTGSTLSNYEFGTWTPAVYVPGPSWSGTASTGYYEVIGDMVRAYFKISTTSYPANYPMNINNLPIPASATAAYLGGVQVYTNTSSVQIGRATTGIIVSSNRVHFKTLQTSGNVNELIDSKYQPTGATGTLEGLITYKKA